MSFSNLNCEKKYSENKFEKKILPNDYVEKKLCDNIQIRTEISEQNNVINLNRQTTVNTRMNQTQIEEKKIEMKERSQKSRSFLISHKPLHNAFIERRLKSRKKSKIVKNQSRRPTPPLRTKAHDFKSKRKKKLEKKENFHRTSTSKEKVFEEKSSEIPKRGKRGLVGGKAKAIPPKEDSIGNFESDEDADSFHFYRISLGYFQKFRDVQGASTSHKNEISVDKTQTPPSFRAGKSDSKMTEEMELLELQKWGMASLISFDKIDEKTDNLEVNGNDSANFEDDEPDFSTFYFDNGLSKTLNNSNNPLKDGHKVMDSKRDLDFRSDLLKSDVYATRLQFTDVNYRWVQTPDSISIEVECPFRVITSNQISVKTTSSSIQINVRSSNESEWVSFLNCKLAGEISPNESSWSLGPNSGIIIYLKKATNYFWGSLTKPQIEPSNSVVDELITDLHEMHQLDVLDIIKTFSSFEIMDACTKETCKTIVFNNNRSETADYTKKLKDIEERSDKFD